MHISIGLPRKEESGAAVDIADIARAMSLGKVGGWGARDGRRTYPGWIAGSFGRYGVYAIELHILLLEARSFVSG